MKFLIITVRSLVWMLLSLLCTLTMLSAVLSPAWITTVVREAKIDNETIKFTPSLGVYAKCDKPIGKNRQTCTLMSADGLLFADSTVYPSVWKAATIFLLFGVTIMCSTVFASVLSCCVQSCFKKSIFTLTGAAQCIAGICFILGVMLEPMAWGTHRVHRLCGRTSSPFYLGECMLGLGMYVAIAGTVLTFICACLSVPADKSTSSDKVQDKIFEGQTLICLT